MTPVKPTSSGRTLQTKRPTPLGLARNAVAGQQGDDAHLDYSGAAALHELHGCSEGEKAVPSSSSRIC